MLVVDHLIAELAAKQCGVVARFQILELGAAPGLIARRVNRGAWRRVAPGVYALPSHRESQHRRLWIAYLAAGQNAVVSHHSSAWDFGWPGFTGKDLHLTVPHSEHQRVDGATVHQSRFLPRHHWIVFGGRRTTTMARTLVDLAPHVSRKRLDLAYEHAIVTKHLTHAKATRCLMELAVPSRKGLRKYGSILDERGPGYVASATELERLLFQIAEQAGLTGLVRQLPHPGRQDVNGCVDIGLVEPKLILEGDGRRWHTRLDDLARDLARDKQAARAGWQTLRFIYSELVGDPDDAAATMWDVYEERLALLRRK